MLLSDPKGIMFAAILVPRMDTIQQNASRKTANRVDPDQYLSRIASSRSHGFHKLRCQVLLMAAVERIPRDAETVTAIGFVISWDH
jgi:nucleoside permease NupC